MIVLEQDERLLEWARQVLKVKFEPNQATWISLVDDEIRAVVVYTRFSTHNCEMSIATDNAKTWATRKFMRACYRYAFDQLKVARVTVVIEEDNEASIELCRRLGHVEEGRLKHWFGDKDGILMRMTREECKYL